MKHLLAKCLLASSLVIPLASATTLVIFYRPAEGAILATDSCITEVGVGEVRQGRIISGKLAVGCKINRCGPYLVAGAGLSLELDRVCKTPENLTTLSSLRTAVAKAGVEQANRYVSDLVRANQKPRDGDVLVSLAIAGYENHRPVLAYFDITLVAIQQGQAHFRLTGQVTCPQDIRCTDLNLVAGENRAILATRDFKNLGKRLLLAEELVQIEVAAHKGKTVLPPITVVQFKSLRPYWFRRGLCSDSR